ncbi:MAG: hypothetical protein FJZ01_05165 [Candidatus Sericytochromatia bacterium]|nr:hypothetical protein [Candidatus Tanganyikabacteria bacterium]
MPRKTDPARERLQGLTRRPVRDGVPDMPVPPGSLRPDNLSLSGIGKQIDLGALGEQLGQIAGNLPASLDALKGWLPGVIGQVQPYDPGFAKQLDDYLATVAGGKAQAEELRETGKRLAESFGALSDKLAALDPKTFAARGPRQDPGRPAAGRKLFPTASTQDKLAGKSWARGPRQPTLEVSGGAAAGSNVPVGNAKGLRAPDFSDPARGAGELADLLALDPRAEATGNAEIAFRSRNFDLSLGTQAGVAGAVQGADMAAFLREQQEPIRQIKALQDQVSALGLDSRLADLTARAAAVQAEAVALQQSLAAGRIPPAEYVARLDAALGTLADGRALLSSATGILADAGGAVGQGNSLARSLRDQTRQLTAEMAAGGIVRARATLRKSLPDMGAAVTDLAIGVSGQLVYVPPNPSYDPSVTDRPQLRYALGAMRTRATVWVEGTDRLREVGAAASRLLDASQQATAAADAALADLQRALAGARPALAEAADLQTDLEAALGSGSPLDLSVLLARVDALRKQLASLPAADPQRLAEANSALQGVTAANRDLVEAISGLEREFKVKADVTGKVVQPRAPFGAGLGLGLSGTVHVGLPVDFALTADNLVGYMPGKEETWRLAGPIGSGTAFELADVEKRNVYPDFFPPTYRLALQAPVTASTTVRADWEKVTGLRGINQTYGVEQRVTEWLRVRGGVEDAPAYGRSWAPALNVEVGKEEGASFWIGGSANSFKADDLKGATVGAGFKLSF